jgi:hypothetical protein
MVPLMAAAGRSFQTVRRSLRRDPVPLLVALVFLAGLALRVWFVVRWRPAFLGYTDAGG